MERVAAAGRALALHVPGEAVRRRELQRVARRAREVVAGVDEVLGVHVGRRVLAHGPRLRVVERAVRVQIPQVLGRVLADPQVAHRRLHLRAADAALARDALLEVARLGVVEAELVVALVVAVVAVAVAVAVVVVVAAGGGLLRRLRLLALGLGGGARLLGPRVLARLLAPRARGVQFRVAVLRLLVHGRVVAVPAVALRVVGDLAQALQARARAGAGLGELRVRAGHLLRFPPVLELEVEAPVEAHLRDARGEPGRLAPVQRLDPRADLDDGDGAAAHARLPRAAAPPQVRVGLGHGHLRRRRRAPRVVVLERRPAVAEVPGPLRDEVGVVRVDHGPAVHVDLGRRLAVLSRLGELALLRPVPRRHVRRVRGRGHGGVCRGAPVSREAADLVLAEANQLELRRPR